tara:strand:+ start:87 stop:1904 length:1818 start_codon:yes stop_codon:yes gene_type:complete
MNDEDNVTGGDLAKSITFEVAANTLLDKYSGLLLAAPDPTAISKFLYGIANVGGSAAINYFAQRMRGGKFNLGELLTAGGLSLVPGGVQAKTLSGRVVKGTGKGAGLGALQVTGESFINEGKPPELQELAAGTGFGGVLGGALSGIAGPEGGKIVKAFKKRLARKKLTVQEIQQQQPQQKPTQGLLGMMQDDNIDLEQYGFGPEGPRGGATDAQIYQAYKEITNPQDPNTLENILRQQGGTGTNPITGQPLQFAQQTPPTFTQKGLFTKAQMKQYTTNRPPGMKRAAYNALRDNGMLSDVIPLDQSLDITEFSRGYISALTNPQFAVGDFARTKNEAIAAFSDKYYQLTRSVARPDFLAPELDHTTPLKVTGAILFPGSTRREIRALIDILYDNGLYAGDDPLNLRLLPGEVHQIATNWVTLNLGRQGQKFLDDISTLKLPRTAPTKKYPQGVYTFRAKQEIALLYANQVKRMKEKVQEAYELFDLLYDFRTPGLGGLDQNKLDQFVNVLERIDVDSPLTIKTIRDIAEGAAQGTPYIFANLQETIEQLQQARGAANEAMEQLFDNTLTDVQRATANRNFDKFTNLANELQETLGRIMRGTIEEG